MNYETTDKAVKLLTGRIVRRFERTKNKTAAAKFDELTVISEVKKLYAALEDDNEEVLLDLAKQCYKETTPRGRKIPTKKWLLVLLAGYDPVTKYIYTHEVTRKRDRLAEAVNSSSTKATEYRRGMKYWQQMTRQYADTVTDQVTLKAYADAGIEKVRWIAQMDDHVCETCRERHMKVYRISELPAKPHWGCRCTYEPVGDDG